MTRQDPKLSHDALLEVLVAVDVPLLGDERRKNWAKIVTNVDEQKATGWAFEGEFISVGGIQDVPVGSVVLVYGERGSQANPRSLAAVYVVNGDSTLTKHAEAGGKAWARTLRDNVAELVGADHLGAIRIEWRPELMLYDDDALVEELRRRDIWPGR